MGNPTGDDKSEPSLELPSFSRHIRRGRVGPKPEPAPRAAPASVPSTTRHEVEEPAATPVADRTPNRRAPGPRPPRPKRTGPLLPPSIAALLTGLLVGVGGALLTYGGLRGCELARGTDSCGEGPGGLLLLGILVAMVLAGGALLAWLRVPDPRSTSFLGVGVTAVVAVVALLESLFSAWMFVVVPLVSAAAYLLAWWVSSRIVEQLDDGPGVDVR